MKTACILVGILLLMGTASALAEVELSIEERVRLAKASEAALRSVFQTIEQLGDRVATERAIAETLLSNPAVHRRRQASLAALIDAEKKSLRKEVRRQLGIYAAHHPMHLDGEWVDEVMTERRERIDHQIDAVIGSRLQERYASARAMSVDEQRRQLDEEVRPTVDEIEEMVGDPEELLRMRAQELREIVATRGRPVVRSYVERVNAEIPLFEENEAELGARVEAKLLEGAEQLQRQLRMVSDHDGGNAVEASEIGRLILGDVETVALAGDYGVFRATRERIDERALHLERQALQHFVEDQLDTGGGCKALPAARVAAEIPDSSTRVPAEPEDHAKQLIETFGPEVAEAIVLTHVDALEQAGRRSEFSARVRAYLKGVDSAGIDRIFERGIARCFEEPLENARRKLAEAELRTAFPEIADRTYVFGEADLERIALGEAPAAETAARGERLHLLESRTMFELRWRDLVSEARSSIDVQEQIVREPGLKGRYVEEINNELERTEEMRRGYEERYASDVLSAFRKRRAALLLNPESDKYAFVFATTHVIIGEIITLEWTKEPSEEPNPTPSPLVVVVPPQPEQSARPLPPPDPRPTPDPPVASESHEKRTATPFGRPRTGTRETLGDAGESSGGGLLGTLFGMPGLFGKSVLFGSQSPFGKRERSPCNEQCATSAACRSQVARCVAGVEHCASEGGGCDEARSACHAAQRACECNDPVRLLPTGTRVET